MRTTMKQKAIMYWNEYEMVEEEVKYRLEEDNSEKLTEDDLRESIYEDIDFFDFQYDDLKEYLTEVMQELNKKGTYWKIVGKSMGWRNLQGYKYANIETGEELLKAVLPNCETTFYIYKENNRLKMVVYHHDSPMGETYFIMPITERTFIKRVEE